jgi:hypothetical protein
MVCLLLILAKTNVRFDGIDSKRATAYVTLNHINFYFLMQLTLVFKGLLGVFAH